MSEEQQHPSSQYGSFSPQGDGFGFGNAPQSVPNATTVLVLGILSIVTCCCYGIIGLILGIVALVLSKKGKVLYNENPSLYTESPLKNLNAGRVCAIIGLVLNIIYLLIYIVLIAMFGFDVLTDQEALKEALMQMQ